MLFRALLINPVLLLRTVQALEKNSRRWVLKLSRDKLQFIHIDPAEGTQVWCQLSMRMLFDAVRIESLAGNVIGMHVDMDDLMRALKSAQSASETNVRLTKRQGHPCLSFQLQINQTRTGQPFSVSQELLVEIMSRQDLERLTEPPLPVPDVNILLPPAADLRPVVETMRSLSTNVTLMANNTGELRLGIENDVVEVQTCFTNLTHPELVDAGAGDERSATDQSAFARVRVDSKQLAKFLHSYQLQPAHVVCCIFNNRAVVLYVYVGAQTSLAAAAQQEQIVEQQQDEAGDRGLLIYYLPVKSE